ncbi:MULTISPECIES: hypothetical protein [unclassified Xanthobacter]|uniref:hypothetical protein n=1 Tax=unclassified Xanthobacter TaxID=2623496 RepID=UPI001F330A0B|nr:MULTISPECIES: hypothetical protein [unclassified Xanthobacter]
MAGHFFRSIAVVSATLLASSVLVKHHALAQSGTLNELPEEAKEIANSVLNYCNDMGYDLNHDTATIENIGNNERGRNIILFQPGDLCGYRDRGNGACSTDGCEFFVFSDHAGGQLTRIYQRTASGVVGFPEDKNKPATIVFQSRGELKPCLGKREATCIVSLTWNGTKLIEKVIDNNPNSKFVKCMSNDNTQRQKISCVAKLIGR